MNKIYAVGALNISLPQYSVKDTRLWVLIDNFESAELTVLSNCGDFFEGYYNYALIEEIEVNSTVSIHTKLPKQWWYQAKYVEDDMIVSRIEMPPEFKHISHWWVG